jgi:hypothetical protein
MVSDDDETEDLEGKGCGPIEVLTENLPEELEKMTKDLRITDVPGEI